MEDFINSIKKSLEPLQEDEEWQGNTIYCKKCGTPRSFILSEYNFITRCMCDCQQKKYNKEQAIIQLEDKKKRYFAKLERVGINPYKYDFEKWVAKKDYQKDMLAKIKEFLKDPNKSIIITGKSGAGKTFILTSALIELINKGYTCEYLKWLEKGKYLKSIVMDSEKYQKEIERIKTAQVLYIDDFLKTGKNDSPTTADISLAFEILDYRKENDLPTMISSERDLAEILGYDEAVGGRINELCKLQIQLKNYNNVENFRLKGENK